MLTDLQYRILKLIANNDGFMTPKVIREKLNLKPHELGAASRALFNAGLMDCVQQGTQKSGYVRHYHSNEFSQPAIERHEAAVKAQTEANQPVLKWRNQVLSELEADPDGRRFVFAVLRGDYEYVPDGGLMGVIDATYGWPNAFHAAVAVMATYMNIVRLEE